MTSWATRLELVRARCELEHGPAHIRAEHEPAILEMLDEVDADDDAADWLIRYHSGDPSHAARQTIIEIERARRTSTGLTNMANFARHIMLVAPRWTRTG